MCGMRRLVPGRRPDIRLTLGYRPGRFPCRTYALTLAGVRSTHRRGHGGAMSGRRVGELRPYRSSTPFFESGPTAIGHSTSRL